jgi:cobalt-precorrin-5B (C1)-methyltransferase
MRESLRCSLDVAAAAGIRAPVFVPGHIGERAARVHFRVVDEQVVEVGNEWGFTLGEALRRPFTNLLILGHPGKLAKLAVGDWDTHSARSGSALPVVEHMDEEELGHPAPPTPTVEGLFAALGAAEKRKLGNALATAVQEAVGELAGGRLIPAVVLIDLGGRIIGTAGDRKSWQ